MVSVDRLRLLLIACGVLVLVGACATSTAPVPDERDWIKAGQTTREDVIKRYGQPDLVIVSGEEEIATYRPSDPKRTPLRAEIPTMQAGPLGTMTTKMETVSPGSGTRSPDGSQYRRPDQQIRIRYDAQGIVQEVIQE